MNNFNRGNNRSNMNGNGMPQSRRMPTQNNNAQNQQNSQNSRNMQGNNNSQAQPCGSAKKSEQPKVNPDRLDNLVNTASKHLNTSPEELKKAAQSGNIQRLISGMSPSQAAQLERILSDENAAKKLLSTPQAQALLRGLQKNE